MKDARADYYWELLKIQWGSMTPRDRKRLRKTNLLLFLALEGIMEYGR
ncbi:hypothetical protein SEA_CASSITA_53 [Microbacterium phage Cassita]|nr:hypothetical protein SEA_CASSITA_53 [Microbacterium phage Cassita]